MKARESIITTLENVPGNTGNSNMKMTDALGITTADT